MFISTQYKLLPAILPMLILCQFSCQSVPKTQPLSITSKKAIVIPNKNKPAPKPNHACQLLKRDEPELYNSQALQPVFRTKKLHNRPTGLGFWWYTWINKTNTKTLILYAVGAGHCIKLRQFEPKDRFITSDVSPTTPHHYWVERIDAINGAMMLSIYDITNGQLIGESSIHDNELGSSIHRKWQKDGSRHYIWSAGSGVAVKVICTANGNCKYQ